MTPLPPPPPRSLPLPPDALALAPSTAKGRDLFATFVALTPEGGNTTAEIFDTLAGLLEKTVEAALERHDLGLLAALEGDAWRARVAAGLSRGDAAHYAMHAGRYAGLLESVNEIRHSRGLAPLIWVEPDGADADT